MNYVDRLQDLLPEQIKSALDKGDELIAKINTFDTASFKDRITIESNIKSVVDGLTSVTERGGSTNPQKAKALFMIGQIYDEITKKIYGEVITGKKTTAEGSTYADSMLKEGIEIAGFVNNSDTPCFYEYKDKGWTVQRVIYSGNEFDMGTEAVKGYCAELNGNYLNGLLNISKKHNKIGIQKDTGLIDKDFFTQPDLYNKIVGKLKAIKDAETKGYWSDKIDLAIQEAKSRTGGYSYNKNFVDQLHRDELLTDKEYTEINGEGTWNIEGYMNDVVKMLEARKSGDIFDVTKNSIENPIENSIADPVDVDLEIANSESLSDIYAKFKNNPAESPFSTFIINNYEWQNGNLYLKDAILSANSGILNLKLKQEWKGKLKLRVYTENSGWFKDNAPTLNPVNNQVEFIVAGGDYLMIDIDHNPSFILSMSTNKIISKYKFEDGVRVSVVYLEE